MTVKAGGSMPRRSISSTNEVEVKKCVLSSKVTFQEVLLIRICTVNVQEKMRAEKYLRKNCYHHIECSTTNSLAAFMLRRSLNSAALVALTHKRPMNVSNGTSTQAVTCTIDK